MEKYTDVVLDLETLGTKPETKPIILSIGAVALNLEDPKVPFQYYYSALDTEDQVDCGHTADPDTIDWWRKQSSAARQAVFEADFVATPDGLGGFAKWCEELKIESIWGNGSNFDNVLLRVLFNSFGLDFPTMYWSDRDMRTLVALNGGKPQVKFKGIAHHALDDAKREALMIQAMWGAVRGRR